MEIARLTPAQKLVEPLVDLRQDIATSAGALYQGVLNDFKQMAQKCALVAASSDLNLAAHYTVEPPAESELAKVVAHEKAAELKAC